MLTVLADVSEKSIYIDVPTRTYAQPGVPTEVTASERELRREVGVPAFTDPESGGSNCGSSRLGLGATAAAVGSLRLTRRRLPLRVRSRGRGCTGPCQCRGVGPPGARTAHRPLPPWPELGAQALGGTRHNPAALQSCLTHALQGALSRAVHRALIRLPNSCSATLRQAVRSVRAPIFWTDGRF
jgi:hypothetical protein